MEVITDLVKSMVEGIVDDTKDVYVDGSSTDKGYLVEIKVGKDDVGKVIGKDGRVASAIRTIAKAAGAKNGKRVMVNVFNKPRE